MNLPVRLRAAAEEDLASHAEYIREHSVEAAVRFLDAADAAFSLIRAMPEMAGRCRFKNSAFAELRVWPIKGFEKHLIFYRVVAHEIEVIRVLHGARDLREVFGDEERDL